MSCRSRAPSEYLHETAFLYPKLAKTREYTSTLSDGINVCLCIVILEDSGYHACDVHVVCFSCGLMPLELGNVASVSFAYDTFVASHAGYIDSGTAGADWFKSFFLQFAPTQVGEFNPLVGDKDVFCNFREHSEHLNSEKVVWTIQSSLEFEITLSFIGSPAHLREMPNFSLCLSPTRNPLGRV